MNYRVLLLLILSLAVGSMANAQIGSVDVRPKAGRIQIKGAQHVDLVEVSGAAIMQPVPGQPMSYNYLPLLANATVTLPYISNLTDGQQIFLEASTSGTAYTITFSNTGTGLTFASGVLGDSNTAPGSATACGTVPATGTADFLWKYRAKTSTMELVACTVSPPASTLSIALGGTGCDSPTTYGSLPGSPATGTTCTITNAASCAAGTAVTSTGSTTCQVTYNGTSWYPAGAATAGSGSGTVSSGTTPQIGYYASSGTTISGDAQATLTNSGATLSMGTATSTEGAIALAGSTSGTLTIQPNVSTTSYTITLPGAAGAQGSLWYNSNGTGTTSFLPDVATGEVLTSAGTTTAPAYSANPNVTSISTGTSPACTAGTAGVLCATEGTAPTALSATDELWADSTDHFWEVNSNGGSNYYLITASTPGGASGTTLTGGGTTTVPTWAAAPVTLTGYCTTLQTSATTAYCQIANTAASTTTEATAELISPLTQTFHRIYCATSAAQGSAKSDDFSLIDVTTGCGTALTCTATNATSCTSTSGVCAVTAGDTLVISDVTTGSSITARGGVCTISP